MKGVTTVVDAGSAGAMTFKGLKEFIVKSSKTRVLAFLHIACHGLAGAGCSGPEFGPGGESDHINAIKKDMCIKTIQDNREIVIGVKVRLDKNITDNGKNESAVFRSALEVCNECNVRSDPAKTTQDVQINYTISFENQYF